MHVLITQHVFLLWEQLLRDSVHLIFKRLSFFSLQKQMYSTEAS